MLPLYGEIKIFVTSVWTHLRVRLSILRVRAIL